MSSGHTYRLVTAMARPGAHRARAAAVINSFRRKPTGAGPRGARLTADRGSMPGTVARIAGSDGQDLLRQRLRRLRARG